MSNVNESLIDQLLAYRKTAARHYQGTVDDCIDIVHKHITSETITGKLTPEKCNEVFAGWRKTPIIPLKPGPAPGKKCKHHWVAWKSNSGMVGETFCRKCGVKHGGE